MNALSFDVEDYFQVTAFERLVRFQDWPRYESRVEANTETILRLLAKASVKATFFVLGWEAEQRPALVRRIHAEGHEIASHGYRHQMLTSITPEQFRADVRKAKRLLEDITGEAVAGYRAPTFTVMASTLWALRILVEERYEYDSSIFPIWHDRYGMPGAPATSHCMSTPSGPLWEIPPSTLKLGAIRVPVAGGGYFRLCPYPLLRRVYAKLQAEGQPLALYFHAWELDPEQPRLGAPWLTTLRHRVNLGRTEARLARLLADFRFGPFRSSIPTRRPLERRLAA